MAENDDLRGFWKTRNGCIVHITVRGISASHGCRVYMGYDTNKAIYYWDIDGKCFYVNKDMDLMSKGVESYGEMKFK